MEEQSSLFPENEPLEQSKPEKLLKPLSKVSRKKRGVKKVNKRKNRPEVKKAATERLLQNRLTTVDLTTIHRVNGIAYGPGEVKIPRVLAIALSGAEQRLEKAEERFRGTRGIIIGKKNKLIEVPIENFNDELTSENTPTFATISGKGMKDPGPQPT